MKIRSIIVAALAVFVVGLATAGAEEKFGVKVYDGATFDADTSQFVSSMMKVDAACYRTSATAAQVTEFYKKQPGTSALTTNAEGGMFKKGDVNITVQNPWRDMKTGQQKKDTLISIVKNK